MLCYVPHGLKEMSPKSWVFEYLVPSWGHLERIKRHEPIGEAMSLETNLRF